jgi:YqaJ-like viral recombinase domain
VIIYPESTHPQGTWAWYQVRLGIVTASHACDVFKGPRGGEKARRTYMLRLAGERITEEPLEQFWSGHTERGKLMEDEARRHYAFEIGVKPERVGFIVNEDLDVGPVGCSPDSLVDDEGSLGGLEIKTNLPYIALETILADEPPAEHIPQCQFGMWTAERDWWDLVIYWPKLPMFRRRLFRDEPYIKKLEAGVRAFNEELAEIVDRVKNYGREAPREELKAALERSVEELDREPATTIICGEASLTIPRETPPVSHDPMAAAHQPFVDAGIAQPVGEPEPLIRTAPEDRDPLAIPVFLRRSPSRPLEPTPPAQAAADLDRAVGLPPHDAETGEILEDPPAAAEPERTEKVQPMAATPDPAPEREENPPAAFNEEMLAGAAAQLQASHGPAPKRTRKPRAPKAPKGAGAIEIVSQSGVVAEEIPLVDEIPPRPDQTAPGWRKTESGGYVRIDESAPDPSPPAPAAETPIAPSIDPQDPDFQKGQRDRAAGLRKCLKGEIRDVPERLAKWQAGFDSVTP